jgi:hypothetical protein
MRDNTSANSSVSLCTSLSVPGCATVATQVPEDEHTEELSFQQEDPGAALRRLGGVSNFTMRVDMLRQFLCGMGLDTAFAAPAVKTKTGLCIVERN